MPRRPGSYATELFPQQIDWEDGYSFVPSDAVGLGVDFDERGGASACCRSYRMAAAVTPQRWLVYELVVNI